MKRVLPGFGISLGFTLTYLSLMVLIPLSALGIKASTMSLAQWGKLLGNSQFLSAARVSFSCSAIAALVSVALGLLLAWTLSRYEFPGKKLLDGLIDLPFALPTAVTGITLTQLCARNGWIGKWAEACGIKLVFTPVGIIIALVFIGLPFVVRTLQPILEQSTKDLEEAAALLGASRARTFFRVLLPRLAPALWGGFAMAFARGVGEYGSVIFISGNIPGKTEILPLLIVSKLEQFDYEGAAAIATAMLITSLIMLLFIQFLSKRSRAKQAA